MGIIFYNMAWLCLIWMISILMGFIWACNRKVAAAIIMGGMTVFVVFLCITMLFYSDTTNFEYDFWRNIGALIGGFTARRVASIGEELKISVLGE